MHGQWRWVILITWYEWPSSKLLKQHLSKHLSVLTSFCAGCIYRGAAIRMMVPLCICHFCT